MKHTPHNGLTKCQTDPEMLQKAKGPAELLKFNAQTTTPPGKRTTGDRPSTQK